jgi:PleD family two-component response regulator
LELSKYGGNIDGIGLYELMVVPRGVYKRAISAIKENRVRDFYKILGVKPSKSSINQENGSRILIIEDELELAVAVENALKSRGYNVEYSKDKSLLEDASHEEINLIILDLTIKDIDVLNMCRILRADEHTAHIPIIIINGHKDECDIVEGLQAGADDYICSGFSIEELAARVKAVLRTYH